MSTKDWLQLAFDVWILGAVIFTPLTSEFRFMPKRRLLCIILWPVLLPFSFIVSIDFSKTRHRAVLRAMDKHESDPEYDERISDLLEWKDE